MEKGKMNKFLAITQYASAVIDRTLFIHFSWYIPLQVIDRQLFIMCWTVFQEFCIKHWSDYLRILVHGWASEQLTYSMVQSPSSEANWFAASQEIPRISRNTNVHYRTHKSPPAVPIQGQTNPAQILTSHILEIHPNIIYPSTSISPSGIFPSDFSTKTLNTSLLTHTRHMLSPSHSAFYLPHMTINQQQINCTFSHKTTSYQSTNNAAPTSILSSLTL